MTTLHSLVTVIVAAGGLLLIATSWATLHQCVLSDREANMALEKNSSLAWRGVEKNLRLGWVLWSLLIFFGGFNSVAGAAGITVTIYDDTEKASDQTVVALIPKHQPDYSKQPTAIMDQRDNNFVPGVLAVRVNTLVHFPNSDNVRHHVYSFSPAKRFELRLYHGATAEPVLFEQPGQVVLGCNIHDSMLGYIYVLETPWFGISDKGGVVTLEGIPPGEYALEVHHPRLDPNHTLPNETLMLTDKQHLQKTIHLPRLLPDPRSLSPDNELESLFKR